MNKTYFLSFLFPQTIYSTVSKLNGEIKVIKLFGKKELIIGGLQQSGDLVAGLWKRGLKEIKKWRNGEIKQILLLGLGGGSVIPVLIKKFPNAKITAVEIDPMIIEIAKNYFGLQQYKKITIKQSDAFKYISKNNSFDLILVDLFSGEIMPEELSSQSFLQNLHEQLTKNGVVIINRLRSTKRGNELTEYKKLLQNYFNKVDTVDPLVNRLFICYK